MPSPSHPSTPRTRWFAGRESILTDTTAAHALLKQANGAGEHLLAVEIAEAVLAVGKTDAAPILQQLGRALAILGSSDEARLALERIPAGRTDAAETLGLLGRVKKDLAAAAKTETERAAFLSESRESYLAGHEAALASGDTDGAAYCGINAAAISAWLGDTGSARALAEKTLSLTEGLTDYYSTATRAEASLILGQQDQAFALYREAASIAGNENRWADLASTRKQCRELSFKLHGRRDHCDSCFPPGTIGVFSGEPVAEAHPEIVASEVKSWLASQSVRAVFSGARNGWELTLLGIARDAGVETHIILPCPPDTFLTANPPLSAEPWASSFHTALEQAKSVTELSTDTIGQDFTDRITTARASLLADHLGFALRALAVGEAFEKTALGLWQHANLNIRALRPSDPSAQSVPDKESPPGAVPFERALKPADLKARFRVVAHLHFAGHADLSGEDFNGFQQRTLGVIATRLALSSHPPVSREGFAGDYLLTFADLHSASACCLDLLQALKDTEPGPGHLIPSICLNAGPVRPLINPVLNFHSDEGTVVTRAGVIARSIPSGGIVATETFVALTSLDSVRSFRFEHSGKLSFPGFTERIFRIQSA